MINPLKTVILVLTAVVCLSTAALADMTVNPQIRIKLTRFFPSGTQSITVTSDAPFVVCDPSGVSIVQAPSGESYSFISVGTTAVSIATAAADSDSEETESGVSTTAPFFTVQPAAGSTIAITNGAANGLAHHYRGNITIFPGLGIIDTLPLEDYLKGVLNPEIGASAPVEALKAQAVAARTYTIKNLGKMALSGADMDDTTNTQSYIGEDGETPAIDDAVSNTAGEVLVYGGSLIDAVYSTDCGGTTAAGNPGEPYLSPVLDPECAAQPPWQLTLSTDQAYSLLGSPANSASADVQIKVSQTDSSGRVTELTVSKGGAHKEITGIELRKFLGYDKLRSTLFKISKAADGSFSIVGQGWGHGLGMCQKGAIYLAQHSCLYTNILRHYYTGASITQLDSTMINASTESQMASSLTALSTPTAP